MVHVSADVPDVVSLGSNAVIELRARPSDGARAMPSRCGSSTTRCAQRLVAAELPSRRWLARSPDRVLVIHRSTRRGRSRVVYGRAPRAGIGARRSTGTHSSSALVAGASLIPPHRLRRRAARPARATSMSSVRWRRVLPSSLQARRRLAPSPPEANPARVRGPAQRGCPDDGPSRTGPTTSDRAWRSPGTAGRRARYPAERPRRSRGDALPHRRSRRSWGS